LWRVLSASSDVMNYRDRKMTEFLTPYTTFILLLKQTSSQYATRLAIYHVQIAGVLSVMI
jgi:hypothetical protein